MSNQNRTISVDMNAAALKSLGRATVALSELAAANATATNENGHGAPRRTAR